MEKYLIIAKEVALEAGGIMMEYFGIGVAHSLKEDKSPVTLADTLIQELVTSRLGAAYPEHSLYGEEGSTMKESEFVWVFDPVDGTAPFLRGIPTNVFSIALVKDGVPILGVVYDPHLKRLYHAVQGGGAFMNDVSIHTASRTELAQSYIVIDGFKGFKNLEFLEDARKAGIRFLSYSSTIYAHMLVASGQMDGVIFPLHNPWDCAAAKVIIEEAGGTTSDVRGASQRYDRETGGFVSAGTPEYHAKLLALIAPSV